VKLLDIKNLRVYFEAEGGIVKANDGVSLELGESEILGLIGRNRVWKIHFRKGGDEASLREGKG